MLWLTRLLVASSSCVVVLGEKDRGRGRESVCEEKRNRNRARGQHAALPIRVTMTSNIQLSRQEGSSSTAAAWAACQTGSRGGTRYGQGQSKGVRAPLPPVGRPQPGRKPARQAGPSAASLAAGPQALGEYSAIWNGCRHVGNANAVRLAKQEREREPKRDGVGLTLGLKK